MNYRSLFEKWIEKKLKPLELNPFLINNQRQEFIKKLYRNGDQLDSSPISVFCNWLRNVDNDISTVFLWGSYVQGLDDKYSFNRLKINNKRQPFMTCGPSDIDTLLITKKKISQPELLAEYSILDSNLNQVDTMKLNIFRDVFIVEEKNLESYVKDCPSKYLDLYLVAFFHTGLLLKSNQNINTKFEHLRKERKEYIEGAKKYFNSKFQWFRDFTGISIHAQNQSV